MALLIRSRDRAGVLVLRPEPGASATAARAHAMELGCIVAPLFTVHALGWQLPDPAEFDAVMMTSANAARLGGAGLTALRGLPLYAVGAATAAAARAAGFARVIAGDEDVAALVPRAARDGVRTLLHLAGREHRAPVASGVVVTTRIVYASDALAALPDIAAAALHRGAVALLHSPRAATLFASLLTAAGLDRDAIAIAALSPAVSAAAGVGWRDAAIADMPTDDALLAAAARLCDQDRHAGG